MIKSARTVAAVAACAMLTVAQQTVAQMGAIPPGLRTPDKVETRIGTLEFKDGAPTVETAEKVRDALDFTRALNVFNNSFRGASAYAIGKGFQSIGADDNSVIIFSELMDAKSLFLTANADTVYYMAVVNLTKGPMVVEQPPRGLGTINDMWFSWIIDIGFPGPDRGEGGKYLLVPPGYDGPLPEGGFYIARSKTNRVLYAARSFLVNNDPKPTVELIKKHLKIYPYTPGGVGTSIATALDGKVRLAKNLPIPETKFVEGSGKVIQHDSAQRLRVLRDDQREPAAGAGDQLRRGTRGPAGRHRHRQRQAVQAGCADEEDSYRRRGRGQRRWSNAELALRGGASGVVVLPQLDVGQHAVGGRRRLRDAAARSHPRGHVQAVPADRRPHPRLAHGVLLRLHARFAGHDHAHSRRRLAVPHGLPRQWRQSLRRRQDLQGARCPRAFPRGRSGRSPCTTTSRARCSTRRSAIRALAARAIRRRPPKASADGSTTIYFGPKQPDGVKRGNWIQTIPGKGWFTILRLYSPLEPFFDKSWRPSEIEPVK